MDIERFRQIIKYSETNRNDIESKIRNYYSFVGIEQR